MKVYLVFKSNGIYSYHICTFATKELAEGYCTIRNSYEKDKCFEWWYSEEDADNPFWTRKEEE